MLVEVLHLLLGFYRHFRYWFFVLFGKEEAPDSYLITVHDLLREEAPAARYDDIDLFRIPCTERPPVCISSTRPIFVQHFNASSFKPKPLMLVNLRILGQSQSDRKARRAFRYQVMFVFYFIFSFMMSLRDLSSFK